MTAHVLLRSRRLQPRRAVWSPKTAPTTFMDPGLGPDKPLNQTPPFSLSQPSPDMAKLPPLSPELLWNFFCYTA
ncbi:MAG: hypothetical protein F4Y08_15245 [Caldilineaceae bacterium SB0662_bin_9]|uniref:Uncharacterized protein n=1 Tax=Caldilineaceae bacterium SB0662_bin_9 TaxID=2605258 RepID=A0A6B1DY82_9CHLR|nr:hypothetical protein [Caldilineaceae bacterium SB0662_bin_9]